MITLDKLYNTFCDAYRKKLDEAEYSACSEDDCDRAGLAAVVRALEPVIADTIKSVLQFDQITSGEHLKGAAWAIKAILGEDHGSR